LGYAAGQSQHLFLLVPHPAGDVSESWLDASWTCFCQRWLPICHRQAMAASCGLAVTRFVRDAIHLMTASSCFPLLQVMSVNARGVFLCLKHQIPLMLETAAGHGAIVITSSVAGQTSSRGKQWAPVVPQYDMLFSGNMLLRFEV
jgi:hypothetical protein